ncbi:MAG: hypothetical protein ACYTG2_16925 [Planctomycetota bacterium]
MRPGPDAHAGRPAAFDDVVAHLFGDLVGGKKTLCILTISISQASLSRHRRRSPFQAWWLRLCSSTTSKPSSSSS